MESARAALTYEESLFYYDVVGPLCSRIDLWETEYITSKDNPKAILDFIRGSGLRPFVQVLETKKEIQDFEAMILDGYTKAYPVREAAKFCFHSNDSSSWPIPKLPLHF